MNATAKIVLLAAVAGALGLGVGYMVSGGGRTLALLALATDTGQQIAARAAPDGTTATRAAALIGSRRPALALPDLAGRRRDLDEFGARPLLINFMASWCAPCRRELPELNRFMRTSAPGGVQVIGIAVENIDAARSLLDEEPMTFPVLIAGDSGTDLMPGFGNVSGTLPYSVLIDGEGKIRARKIGTFAPGSTEAWIADALESEAMSGTTGFPPARE
ncbi:MAG: TlpA disulfide reductase family protein [Lysobacterales bacterium]